MSFYDKIYAHPERPDFETIDDDSRLDAWLENQHTKARAAKTQSRARPGGGMTRKEVFTPIA